MNINQFRERLGQKLPKRAFAADLQNEFVKSFPSVASAWLKVTVIAFTAGASTVLVFHLLNVGYTPQLPAGDLFATLIRIAVAMTPLVLFGILVSVALNMPRNLSDTWRSAALGRSVLLVAGHVFCVMYLQKIMQGTTNSYAHAFVESIIFCWSAAIVASTMVVVMMIDVRPLSLSLHRRTVVSVSIFTSVLCIALTIPERVTAASGMGPYHAARILIDPKYAQLLDHIASSCRDIENEFEVNVLARFPTEWVLSRPTSTSSKVTCNTSVEETLFFAAERTAEKCIVIPSAAVNAFTLPPPLR